MNSNPRQKPVLAQLVTSGLQRVRNIPFHRFFFPVPPTDFPVFTSCFLPHSYKPLAPDRISVFCRVLVHDPKEWITRPTAFNVTDKQVLLQTLSFVPYSSAHIIIGSSDGIRSHMARPIRSYP